ncbi:peptidase aspartic [Rhexocercosporidium sp. MPI-PUGE-AT-0058]|nr:peptidase aspartic [Rhexocercosporidium sp. MPI-PUGE-AT-0058]
MKGSLSLILFCVQLANAGLNASLAPLSIPPSLYWDGNDGWWSTFQIQVGTPGQTVRLLPGTSASAGSTIWVVISEGCVDVNPTLQNCPNERGYLFQSNVSTTWSTQGLQNGIDGAIFSLNTYEESFLGRSGNGSYGYDTINLGVPGSGLPSLQKQVVAGIWTNDFYLGNLGLSPVPFNFTTLNNPQQSMLSSLYNQSLIPSRSWAYTAGAHYKSPPVFGSLTLGGYDMTKLEPNNLNFAFGADFSRDLLVSLQSITYDTAGSSPLLASSIDMFIDSLITEIWLPTSVCEAFAQQFNLTWNEQGKLYLVSEDAHAILLNQNPTFTFKIGAAGGGGQTVDIVLPYAAFDLNLTAPIVSSDARYFPLKQAQNSTQYTLGRTFLQEAYVIADYERHNFSVSQATFPPTSVSASLVAIHPPVLDDGTQTNTTISSQKKGDLTTGAIAGIAIGGVAGVALVIVAAFLWHKKRRRRHELADTSIPRPGEKQTQTVVDVTPDAAKPELDGDRNDIHEMNEQRYVPPELPAYEGSGGRHELVQEDRIHEMDGAGIPPATASVERNKRFSWEN